MSAAVYEHPTTGATVTVTRMRVGGWHLRSDRDRRFNGPIDPRRGREWLRKHGYRQASHDPHSTAASAACDGGSEMNPRTKCRGRNGRLQAADPGLMEMQDANEEGTAMHLDLRELVATMARLDAELDAVAREREEHHHEVARLAEDIQRLHRREMALHRRERQANRAMDALRAEVSRLEARALEVHREAGRRGCELQSERRSAKVNIERADHVEVQ